MENDLNFNLSLKDKLEVINNYLNSSTNIILNKITQFMNDKYFRNNKTKNNSDIIVDDIEFKVSSFQNINNSLNNDIVLLAQTKNNDSQDENIYLDNLSDILIKRNKLLNEILSLFFNNIQEIINKDKYINKVTFNNNKNNNIESLSSLSLLTNSFDINRAKSNKTVSKNKDKTKEFKYFFSGRKYENMVNYDNEMKNRKKNKKRNMSNDYFESKTYQKNKNSNNIITSFFDIDYYNNEHSDINIMNYKPINRNKKISLKSNSYYKNDRYLKLNNYFMNLYIHLHKNKSIEFKKKIKKFKGKNKRSSSVIKEFINKYKVDEKKNLEIENGKANNINFINWQKLNLDKLNEIGLNLLNKK